MEDVLKLLTRGNKPLRRKVETPLHSAKKNTRPNPQLYHDTAQGSKRKRDSDGAEAVLTSDEEESSPDDFDFFAPAAAKSKPPTEKPDTSQPDGAEKCAEPISEEECRDVFRSHRLKVTAMPTSQKLPEISDERPRKRKKSRKSLASEPKGSRKQKPIYPQPLQAFAELSNMYGTSRRVVENIRKQAYRVPTEIQLGSLPLLLDPSKALSRSSTEDVDLGFDGGIDLISVAPTGSGKTMAFLVHIVHHILQRRAREKVQGHALEAIIIAPTRELATQISVEGRKLGAGTNLRIVRMRKGMRVEAHETAHHENGEGRGDILDSASDVEENDSSDENESSDGDRGTRKQTGKAQNLTKADILVTTPLVLASFLRDRRALPTVRHLVLDEADVLLDPLFLDQTMKIWDACSSPKARVTFWSGTMSSTVESTIAEKLVARSAAFASPPAPLFRIVVGLKDTAVPSISHELLYCGNEHGKILGLRQLFRPIPGDNNAVRINYPFIIFTQTIDRAKALYEEFKYDIPLADNGSSRIAVLHSALPETARSEILRKFRAKELWVIVTTDLLMRGIDFPTLRSVVNYDLPQSAAAYIHRTGRTGRAGRDGKAVTFWTKEDMPYLRAIANIIRLSEKQAGISLEQSAVKESLLENLPEVKKNDRKQLKKGGVPERRPQASTSRISTKSAYDRRKEHNKLGAIQASKKRKAQAAHEVGSEDEESWDGFGD